MLAAQKQPGDDEVTPFALINPRRTRLRRWVDVYGVRRQTPYPERHF